MKFSDKKHKNVRVIVISENHSSIEVTNDYVVIIADNTINLIFVADTFEYHDEFVIHYDEENSRKIFELSASEHLEIKEFIDRHSPGMRMHGMMEKCAEFLSNNSIEGKSFHLFFKQELYEIFPQKSPDFQFYCINLRILEDSNESDEYTLLQEIRDRKGNVVSHSDIEYYALLFI